MVLMVASTFVGLAVMILLCPLPGMVAKRIQSVQTAKMEKVKTIRNAMAFPLIRVIILRPMKECRRLRKVGDILYNHVALD